MPRILLTLLVLVGIAFQPAHATPNEGERLAFIGVRVIPMTDVEALDDQSVLVANGHVEAVGPRNSVEVPDGYRKIDGRDLTLLPGLVDMHVHLAPEPGAAGDAAQRALSVMLGHGVTTVRSMAGSPNNLVLRDAIERGVLVAPRLYAASPGLNLNNTETPEAAQAAVQAAKQAGYDLIKSHHLSDGEVWKAVQDEARRHNLPVAGHVANEIGLSAALAAKQQVEHLDGAILELLPATAPERSIGFAQIPPPAVIRAVAGSEAQRIDELAALVARSGVYQVPTISLFEKVIALDVSTDVLTALPEMRYVPDDALRQWAAQREGLRQMGFTSEDGEAFRALRRKIVKAYRDAGVPIMAGSDTAQSFHLWGPGLIDEIEALAAAGLTRLEALRSATVVPRDYLRSLPNSGSSLGWEADFGTVEPGARADLILTEGDPSRDLSNLRRVRAVVKAGHFFDRAMLDRMLDQASADAKRAPTPKPVAGQAYVMRHLPRGDGQDPGLTPEGNKQALRLADLLGDVGIVKIFVTDTRRARDTAAHLATRLGIVPTVYDPRNPQTVVDAVATDGRPVLVVGHSNTVPDLVARFGGTRPEPLSENDYGTIWRVDAGGASVRTFSVDGPRPVALGPCTGRNLHPSAQCGKIAVAEDRSDPDSPPIEIHFAVVPASGRSTQAPVAMLPGGPGLGGVQAGPGIEGMFGPMHADRDILLIDQRGTGRSNPLTCPEENKDAAGQLAARTEEEVVRCRDVLSTKADLTRYHTREAVLDMEMVRAALGYPELDLFGMSYGTRVALDYLRLHPDRVGETVIRAAAPPSMMLPFHTPRDSQDAFDALVATCRAQSACEARHPDLEAALAKTLLLVDERPQPVSIVHPGTGEKIETVIDRDALGAALFAMLYIPQNYVQLPPLLEEASTGDFSPLFQAAAPFLFGVGDQVAWGMRWSVICGEDVRQIDLANIGAATAGTFMGRDTVEQEVMACSHWPEANIPEDYLKPVTSDKPVLIISGELDPVAGERWGEDIARTLANAVHLVAEGASHYPPLPGCTLRLMHEFFDGADLGTLDTGCVADLKAPALRIAS
ncbi:alpha/beta fold hydrolase [Qipengyuania spongiae]|uniref:Alpha/beta fold hydrolase n=1 Tax=Qipengyuania spongiae TaxID=2909673 RepID=A0ABY5SX29_9SPHN|nr:alpha/beta fold hydrolase [Qipengyuania spongiae]UVI38411.1 alpha/beta fold hydrolase [Qipengyuania spongiae]